MSDYLLKLSKNTTAKKIIQRLGLPIPMPMPLVRDKGRWADTFLAERKVLLASRPGLASDAVRQIVTESSGKIFQTGETGLGSADGLVFDATTMSKTDDLTGLYEFFHPRIRSLANCGRVVIIGRIPKQAEDPEQAAVQAGLQGFVKSLGKEIGKRGATTALIYVNETVATAAHLRGVVGFLLSSRSAFVSGQVFTLSSLTKPGELLQWHQGLRQKTALVTGAAQGIGRAVATRLAEEGAKVICLDIDTQAERLDRLASDIGGLSLPVNLVAQDAVAKVQAFIGEQALGLDILVNNAGITRDKTLARMDRNQWSDTLRVNLQSVITLTDALSVSALNDHGRIICMSSVSGIAGNAGQTNYATAKSALLGFVSKSAPYMARRQITINAVAPGFIETSMTDAMPMAIREVARRFNALGQGGVPNDIAETVVMLASPMSSALTGECVRVCGLNMVGA